MDAPKTAMDDGPQLSIRALILLIGSLLAGVAVGGGLLFTLFPLIPTDVQRLGILFHALEDETPRPEIVIFGNSVIMSGVDARELSSLIPSRPTIWNCASTGQTLTEAYLLNQAVPTISRVRIFSVPVRPGRTIDPLHRQKYNTLFMNGYRPDSTTVSTIEEIFGPRVSKLLTRSTVAETFASRWAFRQYIDRQVRKLLRSDLTLDRATHDLFHPQGYQHAIASSITDRFLRQENAMYDERGVALAAGTTPLAKKIALNAQQAGLRTIFLFPPMHPDLVAEHGPAMAEVVLEFEKKLTALPGIDVQFIDATRALGASNYIDDRHPTDEGAKILTRFIARRLLESVDI